MPDLQQYPWNLYLINNWEDVVVSISLNVFNSDNFLMLFLATSHFWKETTTENNHFKFINLDFILDQPKRLV